MSQVMRTSCFFVLALVLIAISPGIALAADVVVDGTEATFESDAAIHNLTVKNGGIVWLHGTVITGNLTIQGQYTSVDTGYYGCTVVGNVTVKDGANFSCWFATIGGNLQGDAYLYINFLISEVGGNIKINEGGYFNAEYGPCTVGGNVQFTRSDSMSLNWFTVGGNVKISDCDSYFIRICNSEINGNLQVCKNTAFFDITITDNMVGNNLRVHNNTPTATVTGNIVEGNVQLD